jgi:hypothetical protein
MIFLRKERFEGLTGMNMLEQHQVLPSSGENGLRNTWDRSWVWQISAMSHMDQLQTDDHLLLSSLEFLEAIARLIALITVRSKPSTPEEAEKTDYGPSSKFLPLF